MANPFINPSAKERIGYPTQKPEAFLQRIIGCATNEDDVVLDPFVGGGTTLAVADRLNRKWIGIDGHTQYGTPIQVKKWKKPVGRDTLDTF